MNEEFKETREANTQGSFKANIKFLIVGVVFGVVFVKAEIVSWFRIYEMFRFESFHMFGIIGSAVGVGVFSILVLKYFNIKTIDGSSIQIESKTFDKGQIIGGLIFGIGWAFTGACPGPLFALIGAGYTVIIISFIFALLGTWFYGLVQDKLPH